MKNHVNVNELFKELAKEYHYLGTLTELSDADAERLDKILEIAESNQDFSDILQEVDWTLANELNLLDEASLHYYEDQQAKLREYLEIKLENDFPLSLFH